MRRCLCRAVFIIGLFSLPAVFSQFYRGDQEPRYSRKTPYRQQTDIPDAVFGIGHGARRYNQDDKSHEEHPFFGERRVPERRNTGREDGHDYEENGNDEYERSPFRRRGRGDEEEHEFRRPRLPDEEDVKQRFDAGRSRNDRPNPRRGRPEGRRGAEDHEEKDEEEQHRRPRPRHESREEQEEDTPTDKVAETPSKVVGLNMQMVAGVYPKEKRGPEIEDVEKRGDRKQQFFRGQEPRDRVNSDGVEKRGGRSEEPEEHDERKRGGHSEERDERKRGGRSEEREEHDERKRGDGGRGPGEEHQGGPQQQQQAAPPPPKPQIPPFPKFPKFPGFGDFRPFQPDFPSRSFGSDGGFAGGPWNQPGGPSPTRPTSEDSDTSEDRPGAHRRRAHEPHPSTATPDDSRAHDESSERRHSGASHGKTNARESREERDERRPSSSERKEKPEEISQSEESSEKKSFPTPGRFTTSIRTKKSGELLNSATTTTTTTSTTTTMPTSEIILPTESIVAKLRPIVNQKVKVA